MFGKWLDEYRKSCLKTRFGSQLAAFLIAIFSFLSLSSYWKLIHENPRYLEYSWDRALLISFFHIGIGLAFGSRFILLFSKSKKQFWSSQILWIVGFSSIIAYWSYSINFDLKMQAAGIHELNRSGLLEASQSLSIITWFYVFFALIKQLAISFLSLIKIRKCKI